MIKPDSQVHKKKAYQKIMKKNAIKEKKLIQGTVSNQSAVEFGFLLLIKAVDRV